MNEFPPAIDASNADNFKLLNVIRKTALLRKTVYDFILNRESYEDYFDLDGNELNLHISKLDPILTVVMDELREKGWTTQLAYGGTGLFIYPATEDMPLKCSISQGNVF